MCWMQCEHGVFQPKKAAPFDCLLRVQKDLNSAHESNLVVFLLTRFAEGAENHCKGKHGLENIFVIERMVEFKSIPSEF
jgi:hypothetical protein